jgi:signal peptidase I
MMNTLQDGDHLIISDLFYTPERGDIIVFEDYSTSLKKAVVKRVIGLPGETVEVSFEITPDMLSWYYVSPFETGTPQLTLEPGDFEIMVGPDSANLQTLILNISE